MKLHIKCPHCGVWMALDWVLDTMEEAVPWSVTCGICKWHFELLKEKEQ